MGRLKDHMLAFITKDEIQKLVNQLAEQIENDYDGKELVCIVPLKGSMHFAADLLRKIELPCQVDFVYLQSTERGGTVKLLKDLSVNVIDKHVLILEEIVDSGRKLSFLRNRILASGPASLKIVALIDKPARRELPLRPDYIGMTIDDRYVIGYGMDSEELGRNYSDIYIMKN